jgi:glycosyltransferase involved in cell wall biosynthesis
LNYPRVLLIDGFSIGSPSAGGITLANLYQGWPADRIAQVYGEDCAPDASICPRSWKISLADIPIDRLVRKALAGREDKILGKRATGLPAGIARQQKSRKWGTGQLRNIASAWADLLPFRPPEAFWDWIAEFRPQLIYSQLSTIRLMNLVLAVSRRFSLPIVPHFMDDWATTHYRSSVFSRVPRRVLLSKLDKIIRRSNVGMTISDAMAEEYQRRYAIPFRSFMNCVETPDECPPPPERGKDHPLKFVYVGGLHLNRWKALEELGRAIMVLRSEGFKIEADVYAPADDIAHFGKALEAAGAIRVPRSLKQDEVAAVLLGADVMVHVESFDEATRQYVRYSLSTKIPQYMSAGRPILAYGPEEAASCKYVKDRGCGLLVGRQDFQELLSAVRRLAESYELRQSLGRTGWETAAQRHSTAKVREHFRIVMNEALGTSVPIERHSGIDIRHSQRSEESARIQRNPSLRSG